MDRYLLQKDGKVVEWTEDKLRKQLRAGQLDGLELVRRPHEERWGPLHDLALFREEVPHEGDPRDVARLGVVRGFAWHLLSFAAVSTFFLGLHPFTAIWALFLVGHATRALPLAFALFREGKLLGLRGASPAALPGAAARTDVALPAADVPALPVVDRFAADLAEVRALLESRPKGAAQPMLEELDRLASSVALLREKIAKLAALTGPDEHEALADRVRAAEAALAEADALEPSDLGDRLEQIRIEAEAAEDVEGLLAR